MTGRYPPRCGLTGNPVPKEDLGGTKNADELGLPMTEATLADVLRKARLRDRLFRQMASRPSAAIPPSEARLRRIPRRALLERHAPRRADRRRQGGRVSDRPEHADAQATPIVQSSSSRRNQAKPFFLYLPHAMPHKPLAASDAFRGKSGGGLYGDAVPELDWGVGQVLAKLKELKLDESTLVMFASDNGPWYGGSTGGLRGMKGTSWEGGLRVPLHRPLPGVIPAGRTSDEPAIMPDLFATACAFARVKSPEHTIDGRDLMPLFTTEAKGPHEFMFSTRQDKVATVRSGQWKLTRAGAGRQSESVAGERQVGRPPRAGRQAHHRAEGASAS